MSRDAANSRSLGILPAAVPFTAPIVSMAFGLLVGGVIGWRAHDDRALSSVIGAADPTDACDSVGPQRTRLTEIRAQLAGLEGQVADKERELADLRRRLEAPGLSREAAADLQAAMQIAREGLAEARLQVRALQRTKDQLVDRLSTTRERLEQTRADLEAEAAIREALQSERSALIERAITERWLRTINEAQLDVCEKVGRRRVDACREAVVRELKEFRLEFVHCLRTNQAAPAVHRVARGQRLPSHATPLDEDDRFLGGWYVQLCDPTLPEESSGG